MRGLQFLYQWICDNIEKGWTIKILITSNKAKYSTIHWYGNCIIIKLKKFIMNNNSLTTKGNKKPIQRRKRNRYTGVEVYKSIGFETVGELTIWLRKNYFIAWNNLPANTFIERGLLDYTIKAPVKSTSKKSLKNRGAKGYNEILFTKRGIAYFKNLFKHENQLQKVAAEIKTSIGMRSTTLVQILKTK